MAENKEPKIPEGKEPKVPVQPKPEAPKKEEGKEEGKKQKHVQQQLDVLKERQTGLEEKNEELTGRNAVLQDSLDSMLEEAALKSKTPEAEPVEPKPEEPKELKKEGKEEGKEPIQIEKEIEKSIREEGEIRTEQQSEIEGILTREAVRDLETEVAQAVKKFPNASEDEILFDIEDGSDQSVMKLAEVSHEKRTKELDGMKTKNIEEYKEQVKKEGEGGISVPQSPGSSKSPNAPKTPGATLPSHDDEWGTALDKSKVEGGGE